MKTSLLMGGPLVDPGEGKAMTNYHVRFLDVASAVVLDRHAAAARIEIVDTER